LGTATRPLPTVIQRMPHGRASMMVGTRCKTHGTASMMVNIHGVMHGIALMSVGMRGATYGMGRFPTGIRPVPTISARVPCIAPRQPHGNGGVLRGKRWTRVGVFRPQAVALEDEPIITKMLKGRLRLNVRRLLEGAGEACATGVAEGASCEAGSAAGRAYGGSTHEIAGAMG
jgi:hypothetical protein